jgi:hypothetical protein
MGKMKTRDELVELQIIWKPEMKEWVVLHEKNKKLSEKEI